MGIAQLAFAKVERGAATRSGPDGPGSDLFFLLLFSFLFLFLFISF